MPPLCDCTPPQPPAIDSATITSGQTATLTASGCSGEVNWYSAASGGPSLRTGAIFTTSALTATTSYYASCTINACISTSRGSGIVTVNPACVAVTATLSDDQTISAGQTAFLSVRFTGDAPYMLVMNGRTYSSITDNPYIIPVSPTSTTTYTLTSVSNTCGTGPVSGNATVIVNNGCTPPQPPVLSFEDLHNQTARLTAEGCSGSVKWYDVPFGGSSLSAQAVYTTPPLPSRTTYYASCTSPDGCGSTARSLITVTVCQPPTATLSGSQTIDYGQAANLQVVFTGRKPYSLTFNGQTISDITTTPYTLSPSPLATTTYTITGVSNGECGVGTASGNATVTVNPECQPPSVVASSTGVLCEGESITLSASNCVGGTLSWSNGSTAASISVTPISSMAYTANCIRANGCNSSASIGIAVIPKIRIDTIPSGFCTSQYFRASNEWQGVSLNWKKDGTSFQNSFSQNFTGSGPGIYTAEPSNLAGAWVAQNIAIGDLSDVHFINNTTGFAIGGNKAFLNTTDGGKKWIHRTISTNLYFGGADMFFANETLGWIAGNHDVFRTIDGGASWVRYRLPGVGLLNSIYFIDSTTGWVVGNAGLIYKSADGGITWTQQVTGTSQELTEVFFLDANQGWAVGRGTNILITNDGGSTWLIMDTGLGAYEISSIQFTNTSNGWLVRPNVEDGLYHTTDGGITWNQVIFDLAIDHSTVNDHAYKVQFIDNDNGFLMCSSSVYITSDGGSTWKKSFHNQTAYDMHFTDATHGWLVGSDIMTFKSISTVCVSDPIVINPQGTAVLSGTQTIDVGQTANLSVNFTGNAPYSLVFNGQTYSDIRTNPYTLSVSPATTTTYTLSSTSNLCGEGAVSGSATVIVNTPCTPPPVPAVSSASISSGQTATLTTSGCSGTVDWYSAASGSTSLSTGPTFTTPALTATTTYYASCTTDCPSATRGSGLVTVLSSGLVASVKTGSWHDPATWDCNCVPNKEQEVEIKAAHTVTISTEDAALKNLSQNGGNLMFQNGHKLCFGCE